jgi:amino acid transporter
MSRALDEQAVSSSRPALAYDDEGRRLSLVDLLGLAAGGVIGSGWMLGAVAVDQRAGSDAVYSWLIGGVLMLAVAAVMVELGTAAPKTGGLVFLPLQSSGPIVATVAAAGIWIFYAVNPASEAAAMTSGLSAWRSGLFYPSGSRLIPGSRLTPEGFAWATFFMVLITVVNLLGPRLFLRFNALLTAWKVLIPLLVVALLIFGQVHPYHPAAGYAYAGPAVNRGFTAALAAVTGGGVVYAYLGFQGPMDFAGSVKLRGMMGETARLRWAVYGTICGSIVLYTLLQVVFIRRHSEWATGMTDSPYAQFAAAAAVGWIAPLIRLNALLSPAGSGMVFTHSLTREVAALSRAHLTHRGLQSTQRAIIKPFGRRLDVYWAILIVDFAVGWFALLVVGGSWTALIAITSILALVVYAVPGVVLASLQRKRSVPEQFPRSTALYRFLAEFGFVSIAVVLYTAGWDTLWQGMAALAVGCCLLFGLPVVAERDLPLIGRWLRKYDAKAYVARFRRWREDPSAQSGVVLIGCFALLTVATLPSAFVFTAHSSYKFWGAVFVTVMADAAFRRLVALSLQYMERVPPVLPSPVRLDGRSAQVPLPRAPSAASE